MVTRIDAAAAEYIHFDTNMQFNSVDSSTEVIPMTHTTTNDKSTKFMELLEKNAGLSICSLECTIERMEKIAETLAKMKNENALTNQNSSILDKTDSGTILNRLRTAAISILKSNQTRKVKGKNQNLKKIVVDGKPMTQGEKALIERRRVKSLKWNNTHVEDGGITRLRKSNANKWKNVFQTENKSLTNISDESSILTNKILKSKKLNISFNCYVCRCEYFECHHFYPKMCQKCGDFNFRKRDQNADLRGKIALVTGGRIKIGYETVLKLLRCGAMVITTTRFPVDASVRFSHEADFHTWKDRLHIYALDLRFLRHVEIFCTYLSRKYEKLDILIQNAAQTVRRPVAFYRHLIENENSSPETNPNSFLIQSWESHTQIEASSQRNFLPCSMENKKAILPVKNEISSVENQILTIKNENFSVKNEIFQLKNNNYVVPSSVANCQLLMHPEDHFYEQKIEMEKHFPSNNYDEDHQQVDLRPINSWILQTDEVNTSELIEVNLINSISPYIILSKLTPLMKKSVDFKNRVWGHVILVSSMEGKFNRKKTTQHPHTNCAKASLNMLARTSAPYYKHHGLLLDAVDTGWVTDEEPIICKSSRYDGIHFQPPLDSIDGAARVLDPIFQNVRKAQSNRYLKSGLFYKDYFPSDW